ncbi:MAG: type II toxin-antitoxin system prevent-host-death family antitoxin [Bacillota bacterium]
MARVAAIAELKARLSEYLKIVKSGTEVVVTERGNPIARIIPYQKTDSLSAASHKYGDVL